MHQDDLEEEGSLGFGCAWAGIVETFREFHEPSLGRTAAGRQPRPASDPLPATRWHLSSDWMANRWN